jgi:site-specific DNA-cytosine methylase
MKHLSLFTGSGIGDYAAEQCGIKTVAQCECEPVCLYCLERMFPNAKKFKDVRDVSVASLREFMPIDIISGGFPCQDLSTAGRGEGIKGSRSGLWREMFRIIRQVRPTWLLIENVPAIKLRGVDRAIAPLERIGYTCWPLVVSVAATGGDIPRERLWLVAKSTEDGRQTRQLQTSQMQRVLASRPRLRQFTHNHYGCRGASRSEVIAGIPKHTDGVAQGLLSKTDRSLCRLLGNGWSYPNALLIYQWIVAMDRELSNEPK